MATLVKDTHQLIMYLQKKGYTKEQAEGFVEAVKEFDTGDLVTRIDVKDLRIGITKTVYVAVVGQTVVQTALFVAIIELLLR